MKIEIRSWDFENEMMIDCKRMMTDNILTLLSNGTFINSTKRIFSKKEIVPMFNTFAKDINGVDIYEGDILWSENHSCKGDVWYQDCEFVTDCTGCVRGLRDGDQVEIIGNVYENPEMLEHLLRI